MRPFGPDPHKVGSGLLRASGWLIPWATGEQLPVVLSPGRCLAKYPKKGQAWQTHSAYIAASKAIVVNERAKSVLRCYAFWRCLECWGALRFSDHRGLSPTDCSLTDTAFKGMLTRTKTTGRDKKVLNRALHVDRRCWLLTPDWLDVGWELWQKSAPGRGISSCQYRHEHLSTGRNTSVRYAEVTVLSQVLGDGARAQRREKLLCNDVHSPRAFLTSCTGCLRYPRHWQDAVGGWSPGQSQTYVRTTRRRISAMQARVAKMLREGHGEALGERELEEDLGAFMIRLGYNEQVAQEQVERLSRTRAFVAKSQRECERLEGFSVEKELEKEEEEGELDDGEEIEVSGDDGLDWRRELWGETVVESTGTGTRNAEEKGMSTEEHEGNVVAEVSVAATGVSEQTDFPRFAKRSKTRNFAQLLSAVSAMSKLQTSQLGPLEPASSKLQFAQLVPVEKSSSSKSGVDNCEGERREMWA